jgi:hypothetical protein
MFLLKPLHVQSRAPGAKDPFSTIKQRFGCPVYFPLGSWILQKFHYNVLQPPVEKGPQIQGRVPICCCGQRCTAYNCAWQHVHAHAHAHDLEEEEDEEEEEEGEEEEAEEEYLEEEEEDWEEVAVLRYVQHIKVHAHAHAYAHVNNDNHHLADPLHGLHHL